MFIIPRTGREHCISILCVFAIFLLAVPFILLSGTMIGIATMPVVTILLMVGGCFTCCHMFGYNSELNIILLKRAEGIEGMELSSPEFTNTITCPTCSHENPPNYNFCSKCGNKIYTNTCPICSHENPPNNNFCSKCGNKI